MRTIWIAIGCSALSGCITVTADQAGPFPESWKALAESYVKESFFDPYSLRDTSISLPFVGHVLLQRGWVVCIKANAKNRLGGYTGIKQTAILIGGGKVQTSLTDAEFCSNFANYSRWVEMDSGLPKSATAPIHPSANLNASGRRQRSVAARSAPPSADSAPKPAPSPPKPAQPAQPVDPE